jgi:NADH-quinone oxidoreductase subunit N
MNLHLISLEIAVLVAALGVLLLDLWTPPERKRSLGHVAAFALALILVYSFSFNDAVSQSGFNSSFLQDGLSLYVKRFFLLAAVIVLLMSVEFADRIASGIGEFYALILFALMGMMFAASANSFPMLFASLETIAVTFYILTSFLRNRVASLEAGVKYLIIGALSSAFLVYGIALVYGTTVNSKFDTMLFDRLAARLDADKALAGMPLLHIGFLMMLAGLGFKIASFPFQMWAPDVYQGAPTPVTAFLSVGSKAAGFVLLLRLFGGAAHEVALKWEKLLMVLSALTILYGSLCAIPQRNLKRLLGYSSIANSGFILLGLAAMNHTGSKAILFFLSGYLFTVLAAFTVLCIVVRVVDAEDITCLAGLNQRAPLLACAMTMAMVSLAGVPPLAGFFGKFLLLQSVVEEGARFSAYYWLLAVAIVGVVISLYYYFGVIRAIYWSKDPADLTPIVVPPTMRYTLLACIAGMLYLGIFPNDILTIADDAVHVLATWNS